MNLIGDRRVVRTLGDCLLVGTRVVVGGQPRSSPHAGKGVGEVLGDLEDVHVRVVRILEDLGRDGVHVVVEHHHLAVGLEVEDVDPGAVADRHDVLDDLLRRLAGGAPGLPEVGSRLDGAEDHIGDLAVDDTGEPDTRRTLVGLRRRGRLEEHHVGALPHLHPPAEGVVHVGEGSVRVEPDEQRRVERLLEIAFGQFHCVHGQYPYRVLTAHNDAGQSPYEVHRPPGIANYQ